MPEAQEKSVMQGWRAAALTLAGNVSAPCQASTPGPFTMSLGKTSPPPPPCHPNHWRDFREVKSLCCSLSPLGIHGDREQPPSGLQIRPDCLHAGSELAGLGYAGAGTGLDPGLHLC